MKWSWKKKWVSIALVVIVLGSIIWWLFWAKRPANRQFRQAIERITKMNMNVHQSNSINSSGPSDEKTNHINDIIDSMKDFHAMAHNQQLTYLQRAMAISWLANLYRVGWGPYRRNEEMAKRWAQSAGLRLWNQSLELDFMDQDDRSLNLPMYEPPVLDPPQNATTGQIKQVKQHLQKQLDQMQQRVEQEVVHHQNVHNSGVTQSVAETLHHYRFLNPQGIQDTTVQQSLQQVRQSILASSADAEKKERALQTLDRIETSETPLVRTGMTESQILSLVWNRRHDLAMSDEHSIDLLMDRLSDSVEHGHVVCTTGRVSHVVDTWSGIDDRVKLQTIEQRKQERLRMVQQHVNDMVNLFHPNDRRRWNEGTDDLTDLRNRVTQHVLLRMGPQSDTDQADIRSWIDAL